MHLSRNLLTVLSEVIDDLQYYSLLGQPYPIYYITITVILIVTSEYKKILAAIVSQISVFIVNIKFELADSQQIHVFNIKKSQWCLTYDFGSGPLLRGKLVFQSCKKSVENIIIKKYEENHMCVNVSWLIFPLCCVSYELMYPWWLQSIWAWYILVPVFLAAHQVSRMPFLWLCPV